MKIDKFGAWTSLLCLIHCLGFPVLATVLPFLTNISSSVEWFFIIFAFIFGTMSFIDNYLRHKYIWSLVLFVVGFFLIVSHKVFASMEYYHLIGLLLLIVAHWLNYKNIKKLDGCHPHGCSHEK